MSIRSIASVGLLAGVAGIASVGYLDTAKRPMGGDLGGVIPYQYIAQLKRSTVQQEIAKAFPSGRTELTSDVLFPKKAKAKVGEKISELAGKKEQKDRNEYVNALSVSVSGLPGMEDEEQRQRAEAAILREDQLVLLLLEELTS